MTIKRLCAVLVCLFTPALAVAQEAPAPDLKHNQRVWLITTDGLAIEGLVDHITNSDVTVSTANGMQQFSLTSLSRVEQRRSIKKGVAWGAAILGGTALGLSRLSGGGCRFVTAADGSRSCESSTPTATERGAGSVALFVLGSAGVGALIGGLIALPGRDVVWRNPGKAILNMTPIATLHSIGVSGSVRW